MRLELEGLRRLADSLDDGFARAVGLLALTPGRVVVSGMGKSGHVGGKIAATLASTGTPTIFLHPAEAAHGDLGMIMPGDVMLLISNSGDTPELSPLIAHCQRIGVAIVGITAGVRSELARAAAECLLLPAAAEACPVGVAPTTSTTMMLALGDALAMALMEVKGFTREDFRALHPGGTLGTRLLPVGRMMHGAAKLPLVKPCEAMHEVILEMTGKSFGIAGVVGPDGQLIGTITDGDLRRAFDRLQVATAAEIMKRDPKVIVETMVMEDALRLMNRHRITALFVVRGGVPVGLVHIHDFVRLGLAEDGPVPDPLYGQPGE